MTFEYPTLQPCVVSEPLVLSFGLPHQRVGFKLSRDEGWWAFRVEVGFR